MAIGMTFSTPVHNTDAQGAVLFLLNKLDVGGSQRKTINLANALADRGRRVVIAYLNSPATLAPLVASAVDIVNLERQSKFSLAVVFKILRLVRRHKVRNVVAVSLYPALYAAVSRALTREPAVRFLASVNTTEFLERKGHRQMALLRHALRRMDTVIFGAALQREAWLSRYDIARSGASTVVLYNGVDTDFFRRETVIPAHLEGWSKRKAIIGTVGRLAPEKAQRSIISVVAELRRRGLDVGALIVGSGPERQQLINNSEGLGILEHVRLVDEVTDVRPYLAAMTIFALPSIAVETFSNAALEAMAMGLPVISSDIGGMREMLKHGGGLVCPAGDAEAMCDQIGALLADDDHRERLGRAAREAVLAHFSTERMVDQLSDLLQ